MRFSPATTPILCALLTCLGTGCAEELPGTSPIEDQLHYPMGMAISGDALLVVNSNFDQRYNSGTITALSLTAIAAQIAGAGAEPLIPNSLPATGRSRARIPAFGADLLTVGASPSDVFVASRGTGRITRLKLDGTTIRCDTPGVAAQEATDCSPGHIVQTGESDAFALAFLPTVGAAGTLAVGHLATDSDSITRLTVIDRATFDRRLTDEPGGTLVDPATPIAFIAEGIIGLAAVSSDPGLLFGSVANGGLKAGTLIPLRVKAVTATVTTVTAESALFLGQDTLAASTRGLVLSADGKRAYVSLRIRVRDSVGGLTGPALFNSAIGVVDTTSRATLAVLEVGEELGKPTLVERAGSRTLYVPDIRSSELFALDVTGDAPLLRAILSPRAVIGGQTRELLSTPYEMVVAPAPIGGRTLAFVSNFGNSTLAVIDVSDADPAKHRIIARLGRALSDDGTTEAP